MKNSANTQRIELEREIFFSRRPRATEKDFNDYLLQRIDLVKAWIKNGENVESNTEWINTVESYLAQITNSETTENNKLIAEFMGLKLNGGGRSIFDEPNLSFFRVTEYEKDGLCPYCQNGVNHGRHIKCYVLNPEKLHYDTDWNKLMPVITRVTTLEEFQEQYEFNDLFWDTFTQLDINEIYQQVVSFIKWYNANK